MAAAVHQKSGGNPFFVNELLRSLSAEGPLEGSAGRPWQQSLISHGLREAIRRRLSKLSPECRHVLGRLSAFGGEFAAHVLEVILASRDSAPSATGHDQILRWLDEAEQAGILIRVEPIADRYRFAHGLVRETLYAGLRSADRARLHLAIGQALEATSATDLDTHLSELAYHFSRATPDDAAERAIDYAVRCGDHCLRLLAFEDAAGHYESALRALRLAEETGKHDLALAGHVWRIIDLLESGDVAAADAEIEQFARLASESGEAFQEWQVVSMRAMRAMMDGRLSDAERLVQEAFGLGQRAHSPNARLRLATQLFWLRRLQGRLGELEAATRALSDRLPGIPVIRAGLAVLYSESGNSHGARQELDRLAAQNFGGLPRDGTWLSAMAHLADVCVELQDAGRAAMLYEQLRPYADRTVVVSFAYACDGALTRHLGRLATVLGRWEEAEHHLADAIARNTDMGARPLAALAQCAYAELLLRRPAAGDLETAREMIDATGRTFDDVGMAHHGERARALLGTEAEAAATAGKAELAHPTASAANQFRKEGDSWLIDYAGTATRLRDAKGLRYLAQLLREPGREFHVADLVCATFGDPPAGNTGTGERSSTANFAGRTTLALGVPDAKAKAAYRRRLEDLRDTLDDAERCNDLERAARARAEMEFIAAELRTAYGLHGSRRSTEPAEKLRKAVTNCIRDVLRKLQRQHEPLWRHLYASLHTGTFCSYQPERPVAWVVVDY